jgi:hypothetical protein
MPRRRCYDANDCNANLSGPQQQQNVSDAKSSFLRCIRGPAHLCRLSFDMTGLPVAVGSIEGFALWSALQRLMAWGYGAG